MLIILDTNIFQEDYSLNSGRFQVLLEYAARTEATFILPRIVHDELTANYARELGKRLNKLTRAHEELNGMLPVDRALIPDVNVALATDDYLGRVMARLGIRKDALRELKSEYLPEVVRRAIERRRPCSDRGEEIRDALLWLEVLDVATESAQPTHFISKNVGQFGADKRALHPDLKAEAAARGAAIEFSASLEDFAQQHATRVSFISKEWIESHVDPELVLDSAYDRFMHVAYEVLSERVRWREEIDDLAFVGGGVEVDEFFVNVLSGNQFRIEAHWWGRARVEYQSIGGDDSYEYRHLGEPVISSRELELRVSVTTQILVEGQLVKEWTTLDSWAEVD